MCTEKSYGGNNGVREHTSKKANKPKDNSKINIQKNKNKESAVLASNHKNVNEDYNLEEIESYKKAGEIAVQTREHARKIIKKGMKLLDIARAIEAEIKRLGGEQAFPVNLSIDDVAAHYHPTIEDETKAGGLLKVDIGVHINGFIADSAFSIDLSDDGRHKELIKASEDALENALEILNKNPSLNEIGRIIQDSIEKKGFSPIINLSGHGLDSYNVHSGVTIPNYANGNMNKIENGAYAIEPFATTGEGKVYDGNSSNIFAVINVRGVRGVTAKKILEYVIEKYKTLPFSLREMQEKFGAMARLAMKELEQAGIVHNFPQLIEKSHKPVSQAEHSFIKTPDGKIIVFTRKHPIH
jgi:methionyl aminopeptidase